MALVLMGVARVVRAVLVRRGLARCRRALRLHHGGVAGRGRGGRVALLVRLGRVQAGLMLAVRVPLMISARIGDGLCRVRRAVHAQDRRGMRGGGPRTACFDTREPSFLDLRELRFPSPFSAAPSGRVRCADDDRAGLGTPSCDPCFDLCAPLSASLAADVPRWLPL